MKGKVFMEGKMYLWIDFFCEWEDLFMKGK